VPSTSALVDAARRSCVRAAESRVESALVDGVEEDAREGAVGEGPAGSGAPEIPAHPVTIRPTAAPIASTAETRVLMTFLLPHSTLKAVVSPDHNNPELWHPSVDTVPTTS
jgi:hypothetical protein